MNIVHGGVILGVYLFVIIILYMVISSPFDTIVTSFEDVNLSESDAQVEVGSSEIRIVFDMMFAGLAIVPVIWFVFWVFSREPDWRYHQ